MTSSTVGKTSKDFESISTPKEAAAPISINALAENSRGQAGLLDIVASYFTISAKTPKLKSKPLPGSKGISTLIPVSTRTRNAAVIDADPDMTVTGRLSITAPSLCSDQYWCSM